MAKRRSYTKEERDAVLADVPGLGVNAAARKHGVPQTTLTRWAQCADIRREGAPSEPRGPMGNRSKGGAGRKREKGQPACAPADEVPAGRQPSTRARVLD
jgi:transposase-like protein